MEVLKQKVKKLEVQEPELYGKELEGILVGHLQGPVGASMCQLGPQGASWDRKVQAGTSK